MEHTKKNPFDYESESSAQDDLPDMSNTQRSQKPIPLLFERKNTRNFKKPVRKDREKPYLRKIWFCICVKSI